MARWAAEQARERSAEQLQHAIPQRCGWAARNAADTSCACLVLHSLQPANQQAPGHADGETDAVPENQVRGWA